MPNVEVSWQVTGIRQNAHAKVNRMPVEEDKAAGQPAEASSLVPQAPQAVRQLKVTVRKPEGR